MTKKNHSGDFMGLRFDNHVSIGHVFTTITLIVAVVTWGMRIENGIDTTNGRVDTVEKSDAQQDIVIESMRNSTSAINTSLARIQERQDAASDDIKEIKDILKDELTPRRRTKAAPVAPTE